MRKFFIGLAAVAMIAPVSAFGKAPKLRVDNIDEVIKSMTIEEKVDLIVVHVCITRMTLLLNI